MTLDFIADATDALDRGPNPYVLLVGRGDYTLIESNTMPSDRAMMREWVKSGHWNQILLNHLDMMDAKDRA